MLISGKLILKRERIIIQGRVQGVGCRPFVYRLAAQLALVGWVRNDTRGVTIEVQGDTASLAAFVVQLRDASMDGYPALMSIAECVVEEIAIVERADVFQIDPSDAAGTPV